MNSDRAVALVTATVVDDDADLEPLISGLRAVGVEAACPSWDDRDVDWGRFALAVLRSTWDYVLRYAEFIRWLEDTERRVPVLNPSAIVRWNTDKHYLADLQREGFAVVPTTFVEPPDAHRLNVPAHPRGLVVKPAIGAGGRDAAHHSSRRAAEQHARELLGRGRSVMLQPYVATLEEQGETGLVYVDGAFSHAFRKSALLHADAPPSSRLFVREEIAPRAAAADERALADAVVSRFAADLLYARVDLVRNEHGAPLVLELELAEPSFFVSTAPESVDRFARAVVRRLG